MSIRTDVQALRALPSSYRATAIASIAVFPALVTLTRLFGLGAVGRLMARLPRTRHPVASEQRIDYAVFVGSLTRAAARRWHLEHRSCLARTVLCWWLLVRHHIFPDVRIGLPSERGSFAAHAWVELDGLVLTDRADVVASYNPFPGPIDPLKVGTRR